MSACNEIKKLLPISPAAVSPEEYRRIIQHLEACPNCRALQEDLQALDQASAEIELPEPGNEYWENFGLRVRQKVAAEGAKERQRLIRWLTYRPAFSWPAGALALVLAFFITRAMLPDGQVPESGIILQEDATLVEELETVGPALPEEMVGEKVLTVEPRSQPRALSSAEELPSGQPEADEEATALAEASDQPAKKPPELEAEEIPHKSTAGRIAGKVPEFKPDAVPLEEIQSIRAARGGETPYEGPPVRKTIILKGDTVENQVSDRGLPRGRDLELAERPHVPFPVDDTAGSPETERLLSSPIAQDYSGIRALNKDDFTAADREFFKERIRTLSEKLTKKKSGGDRRRICRELVDMYYQLAVNWKVKSDIERALGFIETARAMLPAEDYPDLDAKAAALKSLLGE